jgi:GxxExxY protein
VIEADLSNRIIGAFFRVHQHLGFGFLEAVYVNALAVELQLCRISFGREVPIEVIYRGVSVGTYRLDMIVEDRIIIEVKSSKGITDADERQLLNYLHASRFELGLLLHFGAQGKFKRFVYSNNRK